jgi:hypothetical protein
MPSTSIISRKLAIGSIVVASYLPPLVGFICGVGHCEVCRQAWLKMVWMVQGIIIPVFLTNLLRLPHADETWGLVIAILIQFAWLFLWIWVAKRGTLWLVFSSVVVLALSAWFTYCIDALIRM